MEDGKPRPGLIPGSPEARAMMFAPSKAQIIDTWSVNGLRGTGSHDIAVENLSGAGGRHLRYFSRPVRRSRVPQWRSRCSTRHCTSARSQSGLRSARLPRSLHSPTPTSAACMRARLAESPLFGCQWDTRTRVCAPRAPPALSRRRRLEFCGRRQSSFNRRPRTGDGCRNHLGGSHLRRRRRYLLQSRRRSASPYDTSPLQRCMRDIQTLTQHAAVAESWLTTSGATLLGRPGGFAV